jgi:hypothetical protein
MRQVNHDELATVLRFAIGRLPAAVLKDLASNEHARKHRGGAMAAGALADALRRYEVLSSAPLGGPAGDDLFANSARRGLPGVDLVSGGKPA